MSDDLNKRKPQDSSRINIHESWEMSYWSEELNCSSYQLEEAVNKVGTSAIAVKEYLKK